MSASPSWFDYTLKSWAEFNEHVVEPTLRHTPVLRRGYIFRGQADALWTLEPSLARILLNANVGTDQALNIERLLLDRFQARAHLHIDAGFLPTIDVFDWWTLMQHYHAPTRVLDWTHSPLVGLYFAVAEHWEVDGMLYAVHRASLDDYTVDKFGALPSGGVLLESDQILRNPSAPSRIIAFDRVRLMDRMVAQQGTFTVSTQILDDQARILEQSLPAFEVTGEDKVTVWRMRYRVPANVKKEMMRRLHFLNISDETLFPGIDGLGRELEEQVRLVEAELLSNTALQQAPQTR